MNNQSSAPTPAQNTNPAHMSAASQGSEELIRTVKDLGIKFRILDQNLHKITGEFVNLAELFRNPEFYSRLSQDFYICNANGTTWFKISVKKGRVADIRFLLTFNIRNVKFINYSNAAIDFVIVNYATSEGDSQIFSTVIPGSDLTPDKIVRYFPQLVGQTANNPKETGKLICYLLSRHLSQPSPDSLLYFGFKQGFAKNLKGQFQFNPARMLPVEILPYMPVSLLYRQFPICIERREGEDMSSILTPLFNGQKELQVLLLFRAASWHQSFFAKKDIYADNTLIVKPAAMIPSNLPVALLKNTRYDSLDAPPIGPNIKPLKFELDSVNDGVVIAVDVYAADHIKKAEKGYDLVINDASGAGGNDEAVHHITVLISQYADLYIPKDKRCVLEFGDTAIQQRR